MIIKRLLDVGARSLLIPYVETKRKPAAQSCPFAPAGRLPRVRRPGARLALWPHQGYHAAANAEICLRLQVETKER